MCTLAWFGNQRYHSALTKQGLSVVTRNYDGLRAFTWDQVTAEFGCEPDVLVLTDKSRPPMLLGLESYPCLTVLLAIDTHIHSWLPYYAQAFDMVTVSLKDHCERFLHKRLPEERVLWLPPHARDTDLPRDEAKVWDLLFVGTVDPVTTPVRNGFLKELGRRLPGLHVTSGDYRELFPKARLVLNFAERGDLNYRVFEALGCGACLITPRVAHGQDDLFMDKQDLFLYDPEDMDSLVALVNELLGQEERCKAVAASGLAKVNASHRLAHRARDLAAWVRSVDRKALIADRLAEAAAIHDQYLRLLYLHWAETLSHAPLGRQYLRAATFQA